MKKFLAVLVCAVFVVIAAVSVFAGVDDEVVAAATLEPLGEVRAVDVNGGIEMRGFTASVDGKYVYGGFLQGGRYTVRFDVENGLEQAGSYKPEHNVPGDSDNNEYCKGLACDDRGYLYVGVTHAGKGFTTVAVVDGDMNELGYMTETYSANKTGINGVAAHKTEDGKYLLYAVTCYDVDGVRCYDVTDPTDIKLYEYFGNHGVMDYTITGTGNGDPSYIAVDADGFVYLTFLKAGASGSKGSHVAKISADGKSVIAEAAIREAYGVCEAGDYIFVSTFDGARSTVHALNKADLTEVAEIKAEGREDMSSFSDIAFGGGTLFVGDHGDNTQGFAGKFLKADLALTLPEEESSEEESSEEPEESSEEPEESSEEPEESSEEPVEESSEEIPEGEAKDVNGDGAIDNKDVVSLFRFVSAGNEYDAVYDINDDGENNNKDVVALFRALSKKA